ncbi:MAG: glycine zipper 2TM domain-containing protein [Xanthomonadales bacterium]|nr:glycine zipper 2TM domain-containing protein [Xanthomonadales bacterium]
MNKQLLIGGVVGAVAVTAIGGLAGYHLVEYDYAEVVDVQPIAATHEVCRDQVVTRKKPVKDEHQVTGTVAGAIIGGVLGSKVGDGSGQDLATVGGAIAGGYAGNKVQENIQDKNVEQDLQRVCTMQNDPNAKPVAYQVTYFYEGREHTVRLTEDPGSRIRLEDGRPAEHS